MTRDANLYHNLVKDENTLTELLANLLQFDPFKKIFAELLAKKLGQPVAFQYDNVKTQKNIGELGRPDLVIEDESSCIFIECKIYDYRELTPNQPAGYLNYLTTQTGRQCALVFLIPYYYEHEAIIAKAIANAGLVRVSVIYWNELMDRLTQVPISDRNVAIDHFAALLRAWFEIKPITFSKEEIMLLQTIEFSPLLIKLLALVNEVRDNFPKSCYKTEEEFNEYGFGCYVSNKNGEKLLWFGCSFAFSKDDGSFLQIGVGDDEFEEFSQEVINRFKQKFGQEAKWYEPWQWYLVPIPVSLIENPQNVKELIHFIEGTAAFCNNSLAGTE